MCFLFQIGHKLKQYLTPMLRTKPMETRASIERQTLSKVMVVLMSSTPSFCTLATAPTPMMKDDSKTLEVPIVTQRIILRKVKWNV